MHENTRLFLYLSAFCSVLSTHCMQLILQFYIEQMMSDAGHILNNSDIAALEQGP